MLKTETNTLAVAKAIGAAAQKHRETKLHKLELAHIFFEHGQWWLGCPECGRQWSVVDAEGGPAVDGFDFEEVTAGDGFCLEREVSNEKKED